MVESCARHRKRIARARGENPAAPGDVCALRKDSHFTTSELIPSRLSATRLHRLMKRRAAGRIVGERSGHRRGSRAGGADWLRHMPRQLNGMVMTEIRL